MYDVIFVTFVYVIVCNVTVNDVIVYYVIMYIIVNEAIIVCVMS